MCEHTSLQKANMQSQEGSRLLRKQALTFSHVFTVTVQVFVAYQTF